MSSWTRTFSVVLVVGGALMIAVAVMAHWLGLAGLGTNLKQLLLIAAGGVLVLIALLLGLTGPRRLRLLVNRYGAPLVLVSLAAALCFGYLVGSVQLLGRAQEHLSHRSFIASLPLIAPPPDSFIDLEVRSYHIAVDPDKYVTELDSHFTTASKQIPVSQAALILVDVWESGVNDGHTARAREIIPIIYEILQAAREMNMLIVHAPALEQQADMVRPLPGEILVDSADQIPDDLELDMVLKHYGVRTLFYVGFATNMCILDRPYGMKRMRSLGYDVILIRDATTAVEFHDTLDGLWATELAIRYVEYALGYTCTAHDFIEGLGRR